MPTDPARLANLVATLSVALADAVRATTEAAAGQTAAAPAALVALHELLDRPSIEDLRPVVGLTQSGTVRLVDRMVEDGAVTRKPGRDGRTVALALTAKGRKAAERVLAARAAAVAPALEALSDDDRDALGDLVAEMVAGVAVHRVAARTRGDGIPGGWLCRLCDVAACGRDRGTCPAAEVVRADDVVSDG
jgi:MarR family transcriptional regulator, negative regulator of the multidrug operon emrRAB